ncbi:hypothetical protein HPP92_028557, partial [Vanilla planifolia]
SKEWYRSILTKELTINYLKDKLKDKKGTLRGYSRELRFKVNEDFKRKLEEDVCGRERSRSRGVYTRSIVRNG